MPFLIPKNERTKKPQFLERAKGFEPSTSTLATLPSTIELLIFLINILSQLRNFKSSGT